MRSLLIAALGVCLLGVVGCQNDKKPMDDSMKSSAMVDDCPHCPGVQTADANGMCPVCHMKVK